MIRQAYVCEWIIYSRMVCQQILNKVQNRSHLGGDDYVMGR